PLTNSQLLKQWEFVTRLAQVQTPSGMSEYEKNSLDYNMWMAQVKSILENSEIMSISNLPDMPWRQWYNDGLSPEDAVAQAGQQMGVANLNDDPGGFVGDDLGTPVMP